jgi:hypothetical protein
MVDDKHIIGLDGMTNYYMNCLWKEYVNESIKNHNRILHQEDSNILAISLALKYTNQA